MAKITKPNPLKYFNDEKDKRMTKLVKAQDGMNYTREYAPTTRVKANNKTPKKNIVEKIKEKISNYRENRANKRAEDDRPRSTAVAIPIPVSYPDTSKKMGGVTKSNKLKKK